MLDKKQLEQIIKHNLKVKKVLFIVSMALFGATLLSLTGFIILLARNIDVVLIPDVIADVTLRGMLLDLFSVTLSGAVVTLLFSTLIFGRRVMMAQAMLDNFDRIYEEQNRAYNTKPSGAPIVDVKDVQEKPKGKYDDLIKEYTKLYEQGLISKEDLENKKKELGYEQ